MELNDIVKILMRRDNLSEEEAWITIDNCQEELRMIVEEEEGYDAACDCIASWLGLEPDYLDVLLFS